MAYAGPKPSRRAQALNGLPSAARAGGDGPDVVLVAPDDLTGEALEVWNALAPVAAKDGLLRPTDAPLLAEYCQLQVLLRRFRQRLMHLLDGGAEALEVGRAQRQLRDTLSAVTRLGDSLGLSPEARYRFGVGVSQGNSLLEIMRNRHAVEEGTNDEAKQA